MTNERGGTAVPKYGISVIEFLKRTVIVEAENLEEAILRVEEEVEKGNIILTDDDYSDREIVPSNYWDGGRVPEGADVGYYWHI
ncbi:DpnD/PcfM family protein [Candidatus Ventrimonas sp. KK005]